jgi:hypothetical protein
VAGASWGGRGEGGTSAALLLLWEEFLRVFRLPANGPPAFVPSDRADLLELKGERWSVEPLYINNAGKNRLQVVFWRKLTFCFQKPSSTLFKYLLFPQCRGEI